MFCKWNAIIFLESTFQYPRIHTPIRMFWNISANHFVCFIRDDRDFYNWRLKDFASFSRLFATSTICVRDKSMLEFGENSRLTQTFQCGLFEYLHRIECASVGASQRPKNLAHQEHLKHTRWRHCRGRGRILNSNNLIVNIKLNLEGNLWNKRYVSTRFNCCKCCSKVILIFERIRPCQEYLLEGRVYLLDPRYRPNASHHPSATRYTTRALRVTPQARNFSTVVPFLDWFTNIHLMPIFFTLYYAVVPLYMK